MGSNSDTLIWQANGVLKLLATYLSAEKDEAWFTTYLAVFLLLHRISVAFQNRSAVTDTRPGASKSVMWLHCCALTLLANWQYFQSHELRGLDFGTLGQTRLRNLSVKQARFIQKSVHTMRAEGTSLVGSHQPPWERDAG
jgi:hypothetical protein